MTKISRIINQTSTGLYRQSRVNIYLKVEGVVVSHCYRGRKGLSLRVPFITLTQSITSIKYLTTEVDLTYTTLVNR